MSSKKPIRNQRITSKRGRRQQQLLEVSVRRDTLVRQRNRAVAAFVCKAILLVSFTVGAWMGGKELLRRFLWENPAYLISEIRVVTDGGLTREQVLQTTAIVEGENIFRFDLAKAREALNALPQVERAQVERVLPSRIQINVIERRPVAWATSRLEDDPTTSEAAYLIDARGVVMKSKKLLPEYLHLPVIGGVATENLAPGQQVKSFEMRAALELVRLSADSVRFQARSLDLSKGYCVIVTDQARRRFTFGLDNVEQQIERLLRLLEYGESRQREIQTVNLLVERNTPVTFVEPLPVEIPNSAEESTIATNSKPDKKLPDAVAEGPDNIQVRKAERAKPATSRSRSSKPSSQKKIPFESLKKRFNANG